MKNIKQNFPWGLLGMSDSYIANPGLQRSNYILLRTSGLHSPGRLCVVPGPSGTLHFRSSLRKKKQMLGSLFSHKVEMLVILGEYILFRKLFLASRNLWSRDRHWGKWEKEGSLGGWGLIALDRLPGPRVCWYFSFVITLLYLAWVPWVTDSNKQVGPCITIVLCLFVFALLALDAVVYRHIYYAESGSLATLFKFYFKRLAR